MFKTLEPRIIKLENAYEDMSNLLSGKVESVKLKVSMSNKIQPK